MSSLEPDKPAVAEGDYEIHFDEADRDLMKSLEK